MLEVSKNRYNFHMAWRGIKYFVRQKILNVFCPSIARELKALKELKYLLIRDNNGSIKNKLGLTLPFKKSKKKNKINYHCLFVTCDFRHKIVKSQQTETRAENKII